MDWKNLFMSFQGRIGRQSFWLGYIALAVVCGALIGIAMSVFASWAPGAKAGEYVMTSMSPPGWILAAIGYIAAIWGGLAIQAKRWHDRDKSAWWILIGLVPVVGPIWALVENGFLRGTDGKNRFGADPLR